MPSFHISRDDIVVGRVIYEDDDRVTIEFGKHKDVSFHVAPLSEDDPPAEFYTVLFIHQVDGKAQVWKPWKRSDEEYDESDGHA